MELQVGAEGMRVALLGVGAIGGLVAVRLGAKTQVELLLHARGAQAEALAAVGLLLHAADEESPLQLTPDRYTLSVDGMPLDQAWESETDLVIICSKSHSTLELASLAHRLLAADGLAFSLQNGLGHAETLMRYLTAARVLGGSTLHGAYRMGPGEVRWNGSGGIQLGSFPGTDLNVDDKRVRRIIQLLQDAGLEPDWMADIQSTLWLKLIINVAINPLAAICGVQNGALLESPELHQQALAVLHEAESIAAAEGVDLSGIDLENRLNQVLESTATNVCSMLQDVRAGNRTEIDSLCGEIVRRGESHGIPTPLNGQMLAAIHGIEQSTAY
jgi:2-dehydropantoate 2-reductase